MSPRRHRWAHGAIGFLLLAGLAGCDRNATKGEDKNTAKAPAGGIAAAAPKQTDLATVATIEFKPLDARSIQTRGAPSGLEGRFIARPAVVASPCGFHLVVGGTSNAWTALLVGHELAWTGEGGPLLLRLDGVTIDVGLIDAKAMGALDRPAPEPLLRLAGQWESTWLRRDAGVDVPIKDNASGRAHLEPHPAWRVWSATLGPNATSADVASTNAVVATVALDERVLVMRALLADEKLALRALRRLVFAADSIEHHQKPLGRREYVETLEGAMREDPTCAGIHGAHDAQLN